MEGDSLKEGEVLGGCRILSRIGAGGVGVVYKAHHLALDKNVALKTLNSVLSADRVFVERFLREARAAAKIEHPNIVQVYNVGCERGIYYIVMQFVEGESLLELVAREGRLPLARASRIVRAAGLGLAEAHARNIVHRDVKTANILMGSDGRVRVADFGMARTVQTRVDLTEPGTIVGSPGFVAPEVLKGQLATLAADQYALGVVYYFLLSGSLPFKGNTPYEIFSHQLTAEPAPLASVARDIPPRICEIVHTLMAKEPSRRFPSLEAFIQALDQAWQGLSVAQAKAAPVARTPTPVQASPTPKRLRLHRDRRERTLRNAAAWVLLAAAFALLGILSTSVAREVGPRSTVTLLTPFTAPFRLEDPRFLPRTALILLAFVTFSSAFLLNRKQLRDGLSPFWCVVFFMVALVSFYVGAFLELAGAPAPGRGSAEAAEAWLRILSTPANEAIFGAAALAGSLVAAVRLRPRLLGAIAGGILALAGFASLYRFAVRGVLAAFPGGGVVGATNPFDSFYGVLLGVFGVGVVVSGLGVAWWRRSGAARFLSVLFFWLAGASLYAFGVLCASSEATRQCPWMELLRLPFDGIGQRMQRESGFLGLSLASAVWGAVFLYLPPREASS